MASRIGAKRSISLARDVYTGILPRHVVAEAGGNGKCRRWASVIAGNGSSSPRPETNCSPAVMSGGKVISMDVEHAESRYSLEPADNLTAERLFERQWATTLLDQVLTELRQELARDGKQPLFDRLKGFLGGEARGASYGQVAAELGMTEGAVKTAVHRLRRRYRRLLRARIAQTVASAEEIDDEIRHLFAALGA